MITPEQVPKASITALRGLICCGCDTCLSKAIAAALNAWPGMSQLAENDSASIREMAALILPLHTEKSK